MLSLCRFSGLHGVVQAHRSWRFGPRMMFGADHDHIGAASRNAILWWLCSGAIHAAYTFGRSWIIEQDSGLRARLSRHDPYLHRVVLLQCHISDLPPIGRDGRPLGRKALIPNHSLRNRKKKTC